MATSTYVFDNNDTLIKIANIFNTSVRALVKLNPWLKDSNGKTYLKPVEAEVIQYLDEAFFIENEQAYNLLTNDGYYIITLTTAPKDLKVEVTYNSNRKDYLFLGFDDRFYFENTGACQEKFSKFNYSSLSFLITDHNYAKTIVEMKLTYNLMYITIPIVGNGASSTEDYLLNLNDVIGLQYNTTIANFIASYSKTNKDTWYNGYNLANIDVYNANLVDDAVGDSYRNDGNNPYLNSLEQTEFIPIYFSNRYRDADLSKTELERMIQAAIYAAGNNTEITGITMDRTQFEAKKRGKKVSAYETVGNAFYSKCRVIVGKTVLNMPCFPDSVEDGTEANYSTTEILGRSEPFLIYNNTSGRKLSFTFVMHREMTENEAEIETIVKVLESGVYPQYGSDIAPQKVTVIIGNQIYITGVMLSERTTWSGPIDINKDKNTNVPADKYNMVSVTFTVAESTNNPKSASDIATMGGYRNS